VRLAGRLVLQPGPQRNLDGPAERADLTLESLDHPNGAN
jgi:hypothetical protein